MADTKVETVTNDLKALSEDAKKVAKEIKEDALEKSTELSNKCLDLLTTVVATAKEVPGAAAAKTKEVALSTDDYVHQNPWRAVTIAAGVGLVFGFLFAKK